MRFSILYLLLLAFLGSCNSKPEADTILYHGKIVTVDSNFTIAQAIAVKEGKIIAIGSDEEIEKYIGGKTEKIDLADRTVIPGLIDNHAHPVTASQSELAGEIPDVHTIKELLNWIATQSDIKKPGEWIIHPKFFITRMLDMRQLTLKELDSVAPDHPVFLDGSFGGMINTRAIQVSGLTNSKHPGILRSAETGKLSGFIHSSAFPLLAIPASRPLTEDEQVSALKDLFNRYNKMGITSICSGGGDTSEYSLYKNLLQRDVLTVRIFHNFLFSFKSGVTEEEVNKRLDDLGRKPGDGDDMVKVGAFKLMIDGGMLTGTAYLNEGWGTKAKKIYGINDPHYRGNIFYTAHDLRKLIAIANKRGWKFSSHVTGGGGVDTLISALESINDSTNITQKRFSIIHGNFFTASAIGKMAKMKIYADMQPAWYLKDADLLNEVLGTERIATFHPYRTMIDKGIIINGGSDHMVKLDPDASVNPYNPFLAMWSMVTRKTERGTIFNPEQAITRQEALKIYTINNAMASFEENIKGSLEPGKLADLVVLSEDILNCPADSIKSIHSMLTMLNGKVVYKESMADDDDRAQILVLGSLANFGNYTAEILKAEGLNAFTTQEINNQTVTTESLKKRNVVIISANSISNEQAEILSQYVKNGGNLIATMPLKQLDEVFGVTHRQASVGYQYLTVNSKSPLTKGLTIKPMRLQSKTDQYELNGAEAVANFQDRSGATNLSPAIVTNSYGKGRSMAFLYNLSQSIIYTRQGNPDDAGKEMDSIPGLRAMDLFTNRWVDTACNTLNHADEQMRILSRGIEYLSSFKNPLPKIWYFPDTLSCLVTLNNDGEDSYEGEFEPQFNDVFAKGAKMTLYVKEVDFVSKPWSDKWRARGFEISGHPDQTKHAENPSWKRMDTIFKVLNAKLKSSLDVPPMKTVTNHWFVWPGNYDNGQYDFAAQAKLEEVNGIGLDCNYAHYDNNARQKKFLGSYGYTQGNYTGSGLPMKFSDVNGNIINVYQQLNNVYDQQYMEHDDKDGYFNAFKGLMDRSIEHGIYSTISVRAHNNEYFFSKVPLMKMLDYANSKKIPVWSEEQLLNFLKSREAAEFKNISWENNQLTFTLHSPVSGESAITSLVPYTFNGKTIQSVSINGQSKEFYPREIKGVKCAMLPVKPGLSYQFTVTYK